MNNNYLAQRQSLPLEAKISLTKKRIREWYNHFNGEVYISFSGGKDSTVLLDIVRSIYPNIEAVFVDTGLEFPEIKEFVKSIKNVTWLKPKMNFRQVIEKYGYPVVSKKTAMGVSRYRNTKSDCQKTLRLFGGINPSSGKKQAQSISEKWHNLVNAPFKISDQCCYIMKKNPAKKIKKKPFIGNMAVDSDIRKQQYNKDGCNAFDNKNQVSTPLGFWLESDIWEYIKKYKIRYSKIYDMGYDRTGCIFCMFGVHLEKGLNRFQRMAETHPKLWEYCINNLGCGKVLDYIGINYKKQKRLF